MLRLFSSPFIEGSHKKTVNYIRLKRDIVPQELVIELISQCDAYHSLELLPTVH